MYMEPDNTGLDVSLAAIRPSKASYKPAVLEDELNNSMIIFDNGEYDENDISAISIDEEFGYAP